MKNNVIPSLNILLVLIFSIISYNGYSQDVDDQTENKMVLGTNFWNFGWGNGRDDYFKNNIDWITETNPWRQSFLDDISIYSVLRFMDQNPTNNSTQKVWSNRTKKTNNHYTTSEGSVAYEWQIDLCNRLGADLWITVPHLTIEDYEDDPLDNYWTSLAQLVHEELDQELNVYVEYSNETWNGQFDQANYAQSRGVEMGFDDDGYTASFYFHVYAASRLHDVFLNEFEGEENRIMTVICGQSGSLWGTENLLKALDNTTNAKGDNSMINPWNRMPDYLAVGNYVESGDAASSNVRDEWINSINTRMENWLGHKAMIDSRDIKLAAYEGGQHYTTKADVFSRSIDSYDSYMKWLAAIDTIFEVSCHYTHVGVWQGGGSWGAKASTDQRLRDAHKYRALYHYINPSENTLNVDELKTLIYPNPTTNKISITSNFIPKLLILRSLDGKLLLEQKVNEPSFELDLLEFKNGVYLMELIGNNQKQLAKVVKIN